MTMIRPQFPLSSSYFPTHYFITFVQTCSLSEWVNHFLLVVNVQSIKYFFLFFSYTIAKIISNDKPVC